MDIKSAIQQEKDSKQSGIMQYPEELEPFMRFMVERGVKSYLEIGVKRGHMVIFMQKVLGLKRVYACDINYPEEFKVKKPNIEFFHGDSHSTKYAKWRKKLGKIDMVFIDGDHKYKPAKKDYVREVKFPHKFLALHDIANSGYPDLRKLWRDTVKGEKVEFISKDPQGRLLCVEHKDDGYMAKHRSKYGTSCGIGVCWKNN